MRPPRHVRARGKELHQRPTRVLWLRRDNVLSQWLLPRAALRRAQRVQVIAVFCPTSRLARARARSATLRYATLAAGVNLEASRLLLGDTAPTLGDANPPRSRGSSFERYLVLERIGGQATIERYLAFDPLLDRRVVLAVAPGGGDPAGEALVRRARRLAAVTDPHLLTIHDVGQGGAGVFVAMEFAEGQTLPAWLAASKRPVADLLPILIALARAVASAHEAGAVHGALTPECVRITSTAGRTVASHLRLGGFPVFPNATALALPADPLTVLTPASAASGTDDLEALLAIARLMLQARTGPLPRALQRLEEGELRPADVDGLIEILQRLRTGRRRALVALGLPVAIVGAAALNYAPHPIPCERGTQSMAEVWHADVRARVVQSLRAGPAAFSARAAEDVTGTLDGWTARWAATHREVCMRGRQEPKSDGALDARIMCLEVARAQLAGALDVLTELAPAEAERASSAARGLRPPESCLEPPEGAYAEGDEGHSFLREQLGRAQMSLLAGRAHAAQEAATEIAADANAGARVVAEAALLRGLAVKAMGRPLEAESILIDAAFAAQAIDYAEVEVEAAIELARLLAGHQRRFAEADGWAAYAAAELRRRPNSRFVARLHEARGGLLSNRGAYIEAVAEYELALEELRQRGADELARISPLEGLAAAYREGGRLRDAIETAQVPLEIAERVHGPDHPATARAAMVLAGALAAAGHYDQALQNTLRALTVLERVLPSPHPEIASARRNLAGLRFELGDYAGAIEDAQTALAMHEDIYGAASPSCSASHGVLGATLATIGRHADAIVHLRLALTLIEQDVGPTHPRSAVARSNLAAALAESGDLVGAAGLLTEAIANLSARPGPMHADVAPLASNLGNIFRALNRHEDAATAFRQSIEVTEQAAGPLARDLVEPLLGLGGSHGALGRHEDALRAIERAHEIAQHTAVPPLLQANIEYGLGMTRVAAGRDRADARALVRAARARYAALGPMGVDAVADVDEWLAEN